MKKLIYVSFVIIFAVNSLAQTSPPSVFPHGVVVSNGLTVDSGELLVRVGTNLVPVLKAGDVQPTAPTRVDGLSVITNSRGELSLPARYDANDALLAARVSALDGFASGMVDSWYWLPTSTNGIADLGESTFYSGLGILNGSPAVTGKALSVGSSGKAVSLGNHGLTGGSYSLQAWVKRTNDLMNNWCAVSLGTWNGQDGLALLGINDQWSFNNGSMEINYIAGQLGDQWVHVVGTVSNENSARFYLNGVEVGHSEDFDLQNFTDTQVTVGALLSYGLPLNGLVDEVALWNRALSSNEIWTLYNNGAGVKLEPMDSLSESLVSVWHLDELGGLTNLVDSGPATNHLTVYSGAAAGLPGHIQDPPYVTEGFVTSEVIPVDTQPEVARLLLMGSVTVPMIGEMHISRDGGSNWVVATIPSELAPLDIGSGLNGYTLFGCDVTLTNYPPGTSVVMRVLQAEGSQYYLRLFGASWR